VLVLTLSISGIEWPTAPTVTFPGGKSEPALVVEIAQQQVLIVTESRVEIRRNAGLKLDSVNEHELRPKKEVVRAVVDLLQDKSDVVRGAAFEMLKRLGRYLVEEEVAPLFHSARADQRKAAAALLGEIRANDVSPLIKLRYDKDTDVRKLAVRSAARIGGAEAIAFVLDRAENDDDTVVRREAILRLGDSKELSLTPALIDLGEKLAVEPYLQGIALRSLRRLTKQNFESDFTAWRGWWRSQGGK